MTRAKRRNLRAYLVEPFQQIRFGLHVIAVSLIFTAVFSFLIYSAFSEQYSQIIDIFNVTETSDLITNDIFVRNGLVIGGALLGFCMTMMSVVVWRTHKMYGPMVSIARFLGELKKGNYAVRIHIREKDDFQSLVMDLNDLAEKLHLRHEEYFAQNNTKGSMDELDSRLKDLEDGVIVVPRPNQKSS
jgi:signal transduction histidine kinase